MSTGSLKEDLRNARVGNLNLSGYVTADEHLPVEEVVRLMRTYDRTTALVTRDNRLCGIFTERDVLHRVVGHPDIWERPVSEFMTADPTTISVDDTVLEALRRMTAGHFRDLPVLDRRGGLLGNLTDNAVVKRICEGFPAEVLNLPPDLEQVLREVDGA